MEGFKSVVGWPPIQFLLVGGAMNAVNETVKEKTTGRIQTVARAILCTAEAGYGVYSFMQGNFAWGAAGVGAPIIHILNEILPKTGEVQKTA
ncbi:MAG: hypothetical protein MRY21_04425 [Simkaniaceae bacterium]|nr:hypothetical protein [Simkaniaceae bacterium]